MLFRSVWAGTVGTPEGVEYLGYNLADAVFIGIGNGSVCETTTRTGVGVPTYTMIQECVSVGVPLILASGCRNYGDVCKAIAAGCDLVLSGYLFRGCEDTAEPDLYYGMASKREKDREGKVGYIEGLEMTVLPSDKTSLDILKEFEQALQSSMSYVSAKSIEQFQQKAEFIKITQ